MIDRGLLVRATLCFSIGSAFVATSSAAARDNGGGEDCPNHTLCEACFLPAVACLQFSTENCSYESHLCGSGGAVCGGGAVIICSGAAT